MIDVVFKEMREVINRAHQTLIMAQVEINYPGSYGRKPINTLLNDVIILLAEIGEAMDKDLAGLETAEEKEKREHYRFRGMLPEGEC